MLQNILRPVRRVAGAFMGRGVRNVPQEQVNARLLKCNYCYELTSKTRQCKQCGCFADEKAHWSEEHCPLGKW